MHTFWYRWQAKLFSKDVTYWQHLESIWLTPCSSVSRFECTYVYVVLQRNAKSKHPHKYLQIVYWMYIRQVHIGTCIYVRMYVYMCITYLYCKVLQFSWYFVQRYAISYRLSSSHHLHAIHSNPWLRISDAWCPTPSVEPWSTPNAIHATDLCVYHVDDIVYLFAEVGAQ